MPAKKRASAKKDDKDVAASYNKPKTHRGRRYSGMRVGGAHRWNYDAGDWKEKKVAPDRWEFEYNVAKRRRGKAPEGSGAPVGTEYDWIIVAHQRVKKLDANTYSTEMEGLKYKLAHKRAGADAWNVKTEKGLLKRERRILEDAMARMAAEHEEEKPPKGRTVEPPPAEDGDVGAEA